MRAALEQDDHGKVELDGYDGAAMTETARAATPDGERWHKRVKEVHEGKLKLGSQAI